MIDLNPAFPQTLVIYIRTNIPQHKYITYMPQMTNPSLSTSNDTIFFTSQIPLSKECIAKYMQTQTQNQTQTQTLPFFNRSQFNHLLNICAEKQGIEAGDLKHNLKYYTDAGNISNNITQILNLLFKKNKVIHLKETGSNKLVPYTIYSSTFSPHSWELDTKPLYLIPKQLIKTAENEYQSLQVQCPDCMKGKASSDTDLKSKVEQKQGQQQEQSHLEAPPFPGLNLSHLPFREEFAVADIRTFFYLGETNAEFKEELLTRYTSLFEDLVATLTNNNTNSTTDEAILAKYKLLFATIIEILNAFNTQIESQIKDGTNNNNNELAQSLKKLCQLDISIYQSFIELDTGTLLGALTALPPSISSIRRETLAITMNNKSNHLLAIQSYFAFRRCISVNKYLMRKSGMPDGSSKVKNKAITSTSIDINNNKIEQILENQLKIEYCGLLNNVYYFQEKFITTYLNPLLSVFYKERENNPECLDPLVDCGRKVTTMFMYLFIQFARKNYLLDFCYSLHKTSTLQRKCERILQPFTGEILSNNNEKKIHQIFTQQLIYLNTINSQNSRSQSQIYALKQNNTLESSLQILMDLYMLLYNKTCRTGDRWKLKRVVADEDVDADADADADADTQLKSYIDTLAAENRINVIIVDTDMQIIAKSEEYNYDLEFFVLQANKKEKAEKLEKAENIEYNVIFSSSQILFSADAFTDAKIMTGGKKDAKKNTKMVLPTENRVRTKATLDVPSSKIYKPPLLAYYIEVSLELFPAKQSQTKDKDKNTKKQEQEQETEAKARRRFICNSRREEIKTIFQSMKAQLKHAFKATAQATGAMEKEYSIPVINMMDETKYKHDSRKQDGGNVVISINAEDAPIVIGKLEEIHEIFNNINSFVEKIKVSI